MQVKYGWRAMATRKPLRNQLQMRAALQQRAALISPGGGSAGGLVPGVAAGSAAVIDKLDWSLPGLDKGLPGSSTSANASLDEPRRSAGACEHLLNANSHYTLQGPELLWCGYQILACDQRVPRRE